MPAQQLQIFNVVCPAAAGLRDDVNQQVQGSYPTDDECCATACRQEDLGAAVISGGTAPRIHGARRAICAFVSQNGSLVFSKPRNTLKRKINGA